MQDLYSPAGSGARTDTNGGPLPGRVVGQNPIPAQSAYLGAQNQATLAWQQARNDYEAQLQGLNLNAGFHVGGAHAGARLDGRDPYGAFQQAFRQNAQAGQQLEEQQAHSGISGTSGLALQQQRDQKFGVDQGLGQIAKDYTSQKTSAVSGLYGIMQQYGQSMTGAELSGISNALMNNIHSPADLAKVKQYLAYLKGKKGAPSGN